MEKKREERLNLRRPKRSSSNTIMGNNAIYRYSKVTLVIKELCVNTNSRNRT